MDEKNNDDFQESTEMQDVELIIGRVMQVGVAIAAIVMLIGVIWFLVSGNSGYTGTFHPTRISAVLSGLVQMKPYAYIMCGLFLLILTPVLRVVVSIYAFAVAKDRLYVWITTLVLAILIFAMIIGMFGI